MVDIVIFFFQDGQPMRPLVRNLCILVAAMVFISAAAGQQPAPAPSPSAERAPAFAAADVNQDGYMDVVSGPNVFMGPDFTTRQEIYVPEMYDPISYPDPLLSSAGDVTGDGYPDVLHTGEPGRPGFLYVNPGEEVRRWEKYMVIPSVDNEVAFLDDIDGDGLKDIVTGKRWWAHFGENPTDPDSFGDPVMYWFRLVRDGDIVRFEPELINNHTGVGTDMTTADLNGDGLPDVMSAT
ncbi:MAG: VCBS repeat-containing protein, partial [Rhodothermales bacterium]